MTNYIDDYYNYHDEDNRLTSRHGQVEFLTTMRYIDKYLFDGAKILDLGAGTGRYSHALASRGYAVDAVELVPHNIDIFKSKITPGETVSIRQGDACDLSAFSDDTYDITLILGPLYHLFTTDDKLKAIGEALRVTKPCGVVFAAYVISDASLLEGAIRNNRYSVANYIEKGLVDPDTFATRSEPKYLFELVRKENIDELMSGFDAVRLHYVASDGYTNHMREAVDAMDDAAFALYLKYHFATCERPDMVGLSHHTLDIFRKRDFQNER